MVEKDTLNIIELTQTSTRGEKKWAIENLKCGDGCTAQLTGKIEQLQVDAQRICGPPPSIPNINTQPADQEYLPGYLMLYDCLPDSYQNSSIVCLKDGSWNTSAQTISATYRLRENYECIIIM
ncbi:hypothetical protein LOTGIDRAFT_155166 [Lottia gigantea]|uniref:Sushi domain-containing protein n=1 Tax=Lottia gigantea TaxID=225164 RepID=V3ZSX5_LOTGI|nr:hypothetical protein LOTGIDRAFT_155166 [Lottia gigantea]ESO85675.1 hypothetical protein LOTGIDRAFT_155166 [Lottia gigantea]